MMMTDMQIRNKYNTLTPAEAKKLNRVLLGQRQPIRTASVLRKPRAPPIVVTNLDNDIEKQLGNGQNTGHSVSQSTICQQQQQESSSQFSRNPSIRSNSVCLNDYRRHTVNYGPQQGALASRLSLYSNTSNNATKQNFSASYQGNQQQQQQLLLSSQISPRDSFSNLSFRSSRDTTDCPGAATSGGSAYDPTYRFQTMSVDLGHHAAQSMALTTNRLAYDTMRGRVKYAPQRSSTLNYKFSDDSFCSAKSDLSVNSSNATATPTKYKCQGMLKEPSRSASKVSLSSSTYKVFQTNIKKFFRGFQKPPQSASATAQENITTSSTNRLAPDTSCQHNKKNSKQQQQQRQQCNASLNDFSMSDSISRLSLNKSQSPPVCPPPPGELKSMSYLEDSVKYSNYDEFTRARNERLPRPGNAPGNVGGGDTANAAPAQHVTSQVVQPPMTPQQACAINKPTSYTAYKQAPQQQQQTYDTVANDDENDTNSGNWQMTSLPVYYERNLTTVFEEKQASCELSGSTKVAPFVLDRDQNNQVSGEIRSTDTEEEIYQRIKPPRRFDDQQQQQQQHQQVVVAPREPSECCERASLASSHSPALSSTAESVLEFHRQQPATPYRFSFAQPMTDPHQTSLGKDLGLPPRAPTVSSKQQTTTTSESQPTRQDNNSSSSGNSSNCSSQINGINHCDKRDPTELSSSTLNNSIGINDDSTPASVVSNALDKLSYSMNDSGGYGNVSGLNNDADATILSEESTIEGESGGIAFYSNKCAELERTVVTLKNKLLTKEKELTDLQLSQLNNDYTIERLRKQVNKLERENAQLKTIVVTRNANSTTSSTSSSKTGMGRIHV